MIPNFMRLHLNKEATKTSFFVIMALVVGALYFGVFYGIKKDGETARKQQDYADRVSCSGKYETPECLQLRLKKAELKQQYEESIRSLNQSR